MKKLVAVVLLGFLFQAQADLDLVTPQKSSIHVTGNGPSGTWSKKCARIELASKALDGKPAISLKYDVSQSNQVAGAWFAVSHFDMRSYDTIQFQVRGAHGGEMLGIGLKDDRWFEQILPISSYLPAGISTNWQTASIPLKDFSRLHQPSSLDNCTLSFASDRPGAANGQIFLTGIHLIGSGEKLPPPVETRKRFPIPFDPQKTSENAIEDALQRSGFEFFWKETNPENGLVKDACYAFGEDGMQNASIASVGFGLSCICVAEKHGWLTHDQAYGRVLKTLRFFHDKAEQNHGFFYHFYEMDTGLRAGDCELSSIDSGLLFYGIITAKEFYPGTEAATLGQEILDRVDWKWMQLPDGALSMGWKPETKALFTAAWNNFNEGVMLYPLAIGSKTHPIDPKAWDNLERETLNYKGHVHVPGSGDNALFTHQYPQVWLDLRPFKDKKGINYFENSKEATLANRDWCVENSKRYKTFGAGYWGLTASDGPDGYNVDGAPFSKSNGTVAPTAALGSFAFTPQLAMEQTRKFFELKEQLWGRYGFVDGFNLDRDWYSTRYLGIDQGPIVLMIENVRSGLIWELTMRDAAVRSGLERMGFVKTNVTANATP